MNHIKNFEGFLDEANNRNRSITESLPNEPSVIPYQFDDARGEELYKKYYRADNDKSWKNEDPYERSIKLNVILKLTGLTVDELQEMADNYGDESWSLSIDTKAKTVTEFTD
jgi:hypothetical protein